MAQEWTAIPAALALVVGAALYVVGGLRFRRWAVEDRPGIPRYPQAVETVLHWLIYSVLVSLVIVVVKQTLAEL